MLGMLRSNKIGIYFVTFCAEFGRNNIFGDTFVCRFVCCSGVVIVVVVASMDDSWVWVPFWFFGHLCRRWYKLRWTNFVSGDPWLKMIHFVSLLFGYCFVASDVDTVGKIKFRRRLGFAATCSCSSVQQFGGLRLLSLWDHVLNSFAFLFRCYITASKVLITGWFWVDFTLHFAVCFVRVAVA